VNTLQPTASVYSIPSDEILSLASNAPGPDNLTAISFPVLRTTSWNSLDIGGDMMDLDLRPFQDNTIQRTSPIIRGSLNAAM